MSIPTDELELMLTAILNGTPKAKSPVKLDAERSAMWDRLEAEVDAMPEGAVVDIGDEAPLHDLTGLYSSMPGRKA